jgi:CelD/BcsL family acetyltransferase involved in cellulose biosynthesis
MIEIKYASPSDSDRWDAFVESHPDASPYHLYAWLTAVNKAYRHQCFYLIAEAQGEIKGILPLALIKPPLLTGSLCSLPFCDIGGSLCLDSDAHQALLKAARHLAEQHSNNQLTLRQSLASDTIAELDKDREKAMQGQKVRMLLKLPGNDGQSVNDEHSGNDEKPGGAEALFASFKSKLRSQVRKAEKNGISYRQANDQTAVDAFYTVMQANMRLLGSPVHAKAWFEQIVRQYGDKAQIGLVEKDGVIIGAAIILICGQSVTVPWASTLAEYNKYSPNMLLYWGLLSYAADQGYGYFDFGRSSVGEGTYKFKKQWGALPLALDWQDYDSKGLIAASAEPAPAGKLRPLIAATWAKLPPMITNILGPIFRRYISL